MAERSANQVIEGRGRGEVPWVVNEGRQDLERNKAKTRLKRRGFRREAGLHYTWTCLCVCPSFCGNVMQCLSERMGNATQRNDRR